MKNFPNIRNLYQPIQPTVTSVDANVSYTEFMPDEKLLPFIYCYWELKTKTQLAEKYLYRVIADGCVDIFFPFENPDESYIMGFCKSYTEFSLSFKRLSPLTANTFINRCTISIESSKCPFSILDKRPLQRNKQEKVI